MSAAVHLAFWGFQGPVCTMYVGGRYERSSPHVTSMQSAVLVVLRLLKRRPLSIRRSTAPRPQCSWEASPPRVPP